MILEDNVFKCCHEKIYKSGSLSFALMGIEVYAIGGYGEVGKNMTAIKIDDEVVIFDMGLHMPNYIRYTEEEAGENLKLSAKELKRVQAIPEDNLIKDLKDNVKAIIPSHAHLDHIGAIPYLADKYKAPVICTGYTAAVLKAILRDEKITISNQIKPLNPNSQVKLSKNLKVELVNITHSIPETATVALHTPYGIILYATDFKLDNQPIVGKKPNYDLLKKLSDKGVKLAIVDSLYSAHAIKTPSECVAKEMLRDVLLGVNSKGKAVIVTTFSSHIARLKSIVEFGKALNRKVVFLGRSLAKYAYAAEEAGIINFSKEVEIVKFGNKIREKLREIEKIGRHKFLLVVTGHQGEPKATLSKMTNRVLPFTFRNEDHVVFSCNVIPTPINKKHRKILEKRLREYGVRLFTGIHVSGHGAREDIRDLIKLINPEHLIPAHSDKAVMQSFMSLCKELGYIKGKTVHELYTGQKTML